MDSDESGVTSFRRFTKNGNFVRWPSRSHRVYHDIFHLELIQHCMKYSLKHATRIYGTCSRRRSGVRHQLRADFTQQEITI